MVKEQPAFSIRQNGKLLDYRHGQRVDEEAVRAFFGKSYEIVELIAEPRHVVGILKHHGTPVFMKLATSEGISVLTKREYDFNEAFHKQYPNHELFTVPKNIEEGYFTPELYYLITQYFEGPMLSPHDASTNKIASLANYIDPIIDFSETIMAMSDIPGNDSETVDYQEWFIQKAKGWFNATPPEVRNAYNVQQLVDKVVYGASFLPRASRHGDFTPWHLFDLGNGKLGLIDGEHAISSSVYGYDICYYIQRVYSELKSPQIAEKIYGNLINRGYNPHNLQTVLAARAIGGYLDESFQTNPTYEYEQRFQKWVVSLAA
jgi:hypothetical protein